MHAIRMARPCSEPVRICYRPVYYHPCQPVMQPRIVHRIREIAVVRDPHGWLDDRPSYGTAEVWVDDEQHKKPGNKAKKPGNHGSKHGEPKAYGLKDEEPNKKPLKPARRPKFERTKPPPHIKVDRGSGASAFRIAGGYRYVDNGAVSDDLYTGRSFQSDDDSYSDDEPSPRPRPLQRPAPPTRPSKQPVVSESKKGVNGMTISSSPSSTSRSTSKSTASKSSKYSTAVDLEEGRLHHGRLHHGPHKYPHPFAQPVWYSHPPQCCCCNCGGGGGQSRLRRAEAVGEVLSRYKGRPSSASTLGTKLLAKDFTQLNDNALIKLALAAAQGLAEAPDRE